MAVYLQNGNLSTSFLSDTHRTNQIQVFLSPHQSKSSRTIITIFRTMQLNTCLIEMYLLLIKLCILQNRFCSKSYTLKCYNTQKYCQRRKTFEGFVLCALKEASANSINNILTVHNFQ